METFKIKNYEREHGIGTFTPFRHLPSAEAISVREMLQNRLSLPEGTLPEDILQVIQDRSTPIEDLNADEDKFDLRLLLNRLGFNLSEFTYLNWYRFDDVDEIRTTDLITNFSDIWYPSADDLELIDSKIEWVISIHHSGTVQALDVGKS